MSKCKQAVKLGPYALLQITLQDEIVQCIGNSDGFNVQCKGFRTPLGSIGETVNFNFRWVKH